MENSRAQRSVPILHTGLWRPVLGRALLQIKNKIVGDYNQLAAGFRGTGVTRAATVACRPPIGHNIEQCNGRTNTFMMFVDAEISGYRVCVRV